MKLYAALPALILVTGCAATHGNVVALDNLASFEKGVTTEKQVIAKLGKPVGASTASDGTKQLIYSSSSYKFGGSDMKVNSTIIQFDNAGKMSSYQTSETDYGQLKPR